MEIHQQGSGLNVVDAIGTTVKGAAILALEIEIAFVDGQIAADVAQTPLPQAAQKRPERLGIQQRVPGAFQDQVSLQALSVHRPAGVRQRLPAIVRTQRMKRRGGRDQLHHRCRILRRVRVELDQGHAFCNVLHENADVFKRYPCFVENRVHRLGQDLSRRV